MRSSLGLGLGTGLRPSKSSQLWTPEQLPGVKLWLRADAENMVLTGTAVDEWRDMSASAAHFEDQGAKPVWVASDADFGGMSCVTFNGTTQEMKLITPGALAGAGVSHSLWCVHKSATANDGVSHVLLDIGTSPFNSPNHIGFSWGFGGINELGFLFGGTRTDVTTGAQTTAVRRDTWVCDGAANTWELFQNNVSAGTAAYGTDNVLISGKATLCCDLGDIRNYSGKIADMILLNRVLTVDERALLEQYYEERYT